MLTSISSPSPTFPFSPFIFFHHPFYLYLLPLLLFCISSSDIFPGITLPLLNHACLRSPQYIFISWPSQGLLCPIGHQETTPSGPNVTSTLSSFTPSVHQYLSLPHHPSSAALLSALAPGLPLTEREGRGRRWCPIHPAAPSSPHGPTQHAAWPQHCCCTGGQLQ